MPYDEIAAHRSMLFDDERNRAYCAALKELVGPDTRVMDLGAGLGLHGLVAAALGAADVLLVDPSPVVEAAAMVAQDNGLKAVRTLRRAAEELPGDIRADLIVSVFTGNFLLSEDLLPRLFQVRDRHLAAGGKLVPDRARMMVVPVSCAEFYNSRIGAWERSPLTGVDGGASELDYSRLREYAANTLYFQSPGALEATPLAPPGCILDLDFYRAQRADCDQAISFAASVDDVCHGLLGWFDMRLSDNWLSTGGANAMHWSTVFLPLGKPLSLARGDVVDFSLQRPEFGEWTWSVGHAGESQRLSTFLSRPITSGDLARRSPARATGLSARGQAVLWLLQRLTHGSADSALAQEVHEQFPGAFLSAREAEHHLGILIESFGAPDIRS